MINLNFKEIALEIKLIAVVFIISLSILIAKIVNVDLYKSILEQFALFSDFKIFNYRIWQFLTYSFLHADLMHLVFNMFMLYFFSQLFFTFFNTKQFFRAYFLGGIAAGIFYFLIANLVGFQSFVVGASGAVMAVFFTVVGYNPNMRVQLIIFGNVAIYFIAIVFLCFDFFQLFFDNAGGHLAHIGGSLFGFMYGKWLGGSVILTKKKPKVKSKLRTIHTINNSVKINTEDTIVQKKIDVILDKISKSGYDSLTTEEKEFLFKQK